MASLGPVSRVRALLFDVFGTVVDWRGTIATEVNGLFSARGHSVDGTAFADAWRAQYQPAMETVRSGARGFVKLDVLHRENLDTVIRSFGLADVLDAAELDDLNRVWHRLQPWSDAVPGLVRLKPRYILGTLSNGHISLMVNMAKHGGLPWDVILGAEVAQAYKPQAEAYLRSAAALDLPPDACMLVAAHNSDLVAARQVGYRTAFIRRPTEHGPNQTVDLEPTDDWDLVADSFIDLARALDV